MQPASHCVAGKKALGYGHGCRGPFWDARRSGAAFGVSGRVAFRNGFWRFGTAGVPERLLAFRDAWRSGTAFGDSGWLAFRNGEQDFIKTAPLATVKTLAAAGASRAAHCASRAWDCVAAPVRSRGAAPAGAENPTNNTALRNTTDFTCTAVVLTYVARLRRKRDSLCLLPSPRSSDGSVYRRQANIKGKPAIA